MFAGLNLARMLGDKFLKQQDCTFSSEPYVSQFVRIDQASRAFVVMARYGSSCKTYDLNFFPL